MKQNDTHNNLAASDFLFAFYSIVIDITDMSQPWSNSLTYAEIQSNSAINIKLCMSITCITCMTKSKCLQGIACFHAISTFPFVPQLCLPPCTLE